MCKKAIILSGGLGTRLKPFTEVIPKPLMPIGEKAILEIQIDLLKKYGIEEIFLATNYKSDYIENFFGDGSRYGVKLFVSRESKPLSTAGPIKLLKDKLDSPFLVMNGDLLTQLDFKKFMDFASEQKSLLTVTIKKMVTPYAFGNVFFNGDIVTNIQEKADIITYALAGIYFMRPNILDFIPDDTYYGMDMLMKDMLLKNSPITKYEIHEYWIDIGRATDYNQVQEDYNKNFEDIC